MVTSMAKPFYEAQTVEELIELLKAEQGDSYQSLGKKIGLAASTLFKLAGGGDADDKTLDKIADYAGVSREWVYKLAKGLTLQRRYPDDISALIALLERAPADIQKTILIQARALIDARKQDVQKPKSDDEDFVSR